MSSARTIAGALMGICVGESCVGTALAGAAWDGHHWRHVQSRHEEAFRGDARYLHRVESGTRMAAALADARARGVKLVALLEPEPDSKTTWDAELSALIVAELLRANIEIAPASLAAAEPGAPPDGVRQRLLDRGAPEGLCTVQYVALAMLGVAHQIRAHRAAQLTAARQSMPSDVARILAETAR